MVDPQPDGHREGIKQLEEDRRLLESQTNIASWKFWGPYLSERQWGTVREDYSENGDAWNYFTQDQARSRVYRWGEDGLGGICDDKQRLCFAVALWNERDPILKERLFGLNHSEGNHGEDVKEYYFYLDSTPTHSYMKYLYKYPQREYPYRELIETNRRRSGKEFEYELLDTGIFDDDRYFDVFVEYAKERPENILIRVTVHNCGPVTARLRVLPTLWFRNTWSWGEIQPRPLLREAGPSAIQARHHELGEYWLHCDGAPELLFTENESNLQRLWGLPNASPYVKDAFHAYLISEQREAVNPAKMGTKAAAHYVLDVPGGDSQTLRLHLARTQIKHAFGAFEDLFESRIADADEFYERITPASLNEDQRRVHRQALAGMLWSKQYYYFNLDKWLQEQKSHLLIDSVPIRNREWSHMVSDDIISIPDKWEYPWYSADDLCFNCVVLAAIDPEFAKNQLLLMTGSRFMDPHGAIPANEWNFGQVSSEIPPIYAWTAWQVFINDVRLRGLPDYDFLDGVFRSLLANFACLKNHQETTSVWLSFYSLGLIRMALELYPVKRRYEDVAIRLLQTYLQSAIQLRNPDEYSSLRWREEDGFYSHSLTPGLRSWTELSPILVVETFESYLFEQIPNFMDCIRWLEKHQLAFRKNLKHPEGFGNNENASLAILTREQLQRVLRYMLDEREFLSPYGIRSLSRYHADHPSIFKIQGHEYRYEYFPAEISNGMFSANRNWQGPIWFSMNALIVWALNQFSLFYGDDFKVECPTGSGQWVSLLEVTRELANRLIRIFLRGADENRPVYGGSTKFQRDPRWRDYIMFYEYFNGNNGAGLGASQFTGFTGLVASLVRGYS